MRLDFRLRKTHCPYQRKGHLLGWVSGTLVPNLWRRFRECYNMPEATARGQPVPKAVSSGICVLALLGSLASLCVGVLGMGDWPCTCEVSAATELRPLERIVVD